MVHFLGGDTINFIDTPWLDLECGRSMIRHSVIALEALSYWYSIKGAHFGRRLGRMKLPPLFVARGYHGTVNYVSWHFDSHSDSHSVPLLPAESCMSQLPGQAGYRYG